MAKLIEYNHQDHIPVTIRPARETDTTQVIELTSQIWDGEDYVPEVWTEWLQDEHGILIVAENMDRIVGTAKLSLLSTSQWWLEGLRVHPGYQGKGIASQMHHFVINYWEQNCSGIVRLATASTRTQVHHLCEKTDFRKVGESIIYAVNLDKPNSEGFSGETFSVVDVDHGPEALEFILKSETYITSFPVMDFGWKWAVPDIHLIQGAIEQKSIYWHQNRSALIFCTEISELTEKTTLHLRSLSCKLSHVESCLADLCQIAAKKDFQSIEWLVPVNPDLIGQVVKSDFKRDWDESLYIYEKR